LQAGQKIADTVSYMGAATMDTTRGLKDRMTYAMSSSVDTARLYMREYPMLKAFVYAFALFSAIPLSVFATYAISTLVGSIIIASIGVGIVEGGLLFMGGLVLLPFLGGSLLLTLITLTGYYGALYSLRVGYYVLDTLRGFTTPPSMASMTLDSGKGVAAQAEGLMRGNV